MYRLGGDARPRVVPPLGAGDVRRDGAGGRDVRRRVPLPPPRARTARRYGDPNEMGAAMVAAASEAGLRITLLDTCYLGAGIDPDGGLRPVEGTQLPVQRRHGRRRGSHRVERSTRRRCRARSRRRRDPLRAGRRSRRRCPRSPIGPTTTAACCTPTCPSSRPRTSSATTPSAARRSGLLADVGVLGRALHRRARHARDRTRRRRCWRARAAACACARRPSAISPTGSGRRHGSATRACRCASGPTRTP